MSAAALLERLDKVQRRGTDQWSARCPAHEDRGPSLSIKESPDGVVLVHCFAGCEVAEVLAAVGLTVNELFPPRPAGGDYTTTIKTRKPRLLTAGQALELLVDEALLIAVAGGNLAHGVVLSAVDLERVQQAAGRCRWLHDQYTGGHYVC